MRVEIVRTQAEDPLEHVQFIQIRDLGACASVRSPSLRQRVTDLVEGITTYAEQLAEIEGADTEEHQVVGVIDQAKFAKKGSGRWFVDHRGSNAWQYARVMVFVGLPRRNLAAEYARIAPHATTVDELEAPEVQAAIARTIGEELWQGISRLRASRRRDERLSVVFICDDDLTGMPFGDRIEQRRAAEFSIDAADSQERALDRVVGVVLAAAAAGEQLRLVDAADRAGISRTTLKRFLAERGMTWAVFAEPVAARKG
jgi:hypothetical protein